MSHSMTIIFMVIFLLLFHCRKAIFADMFSIITSNVLVYFRPLKHMSHNQSYYLYSAGHKQCFMFILFIAEISGEKC